MLDWITIVIEAVGVVILLMWIVIPIREFRQILQIVKHKPHALPESSEDDARREDGPPLP